MSDQETQTDAWATAANGSSTEADESVEATVAEIEQTRHEMTGTVEAIGDRLAPSNIVSDAKQAVRDATVGKVEDMANQASGFIGGATSTAQDAGGGVIETIKRNPVPAIIAGVGIGWLWKNWAGGSAKKPAWDPDRIGSYGEYRPPAGSGSGGPGQVIGAVGDKVSDAGETVSNAAGQFTGGVSQVGGQVGSTARDAAGTAQQVIGDNALAAAAIAVAAGAALGLVLPATEAERRVMGDAGTRVIDTAKTTVTDTMAKAEGAPA